MFVVEFEAGGVLIIPIFKFTEWFGLRCSDYFLPSRNYRIKQTNAKLLGTTINKSKDLSYNG